VTAKDKHGKVIYSANGKPSKVKIPMAPGQFANGLPQSLYFPEDHKKAGWFKGMAKIIRERGHTKAEKLKYECGGFKCPPEKEGKCCCQHFLYNEADFANVESHLEMICHERSFPVLFLPKFHCELNFIEQCWGRAKCKYCEFPPSSKEDIWEHNVIAALDSVSLDLMRR
jgi:hypothetical protein